MSSTTTTVALAAPVDDRRSRARVREPAVLLDGGGAAQPRPQQAGIVAHRLGRRQHAQRRDRLPPAQSELRQRPHVAVRARVEAVERAAEIRAVVTRVWGPGGRYAVVARYGPG